MGTLPLPKKNPAFQKLGKLSSSSAWLKMERAIEIHQEFISEINCKAFSQLSLLWVREKTNYQFVCSTQKSIITSLAQAWLGHRQTPVGLKLWDSRQNRRDIDLIQ